MDHLGIDVHKKESQICILAKGGELIEQRIRTSSRRYSTTSTQSWYNRACFARKCLKCRG
jgi:hypothetical protein